MFMCSFVVWLLFFCSNVTTCGVGEWWEQRITPYANMTIKGWAWYQGENNMHNLFGNSASGTGYGCTPSATSFGTISSSFFFLFPPLFSWISQLHTRRITGPTCANAFWMLLWC